MSASILRAKIRSFYISVFIFHDLLLHQLKRIAEDYNLTLPPSPNLESPSSIASQFGWLHGELCKMFAVAELIQPERFDSNAVVLLDEFGSVVGNALLDQEQQSPHQELHSSPTESPSSSSQLILSHLHMVRQLCLTMKDESRTQLFFVTGIARLNLSVRFGVRAISDGSLYPCRFLILILSNFPSEYHPFV